MVERAAVSYRVVYFSGEELLRKEGWQLRMDECLVSFREGAADSIRIAYDCASDPDGAIRPLFGAFVGAPFRITKTIFYKGYEFIGKTGGSLAPCVGMEKRAYPPYNIAAGRYKHNAPPITAHPGVRDSPSVSCDCDRMATPMGLRGLPRYRFLVPGRIFASDRVTRMGNHFLKHEQPHGIIERYCNDAGVGREPAQKHYRCRFFTSAFSGYISS